MTIINREEIPQGVLDDIYNHYEEITFDNYGKAYTPECVSRASSYRDIVEHNISKLVMNPDTFMPEMAHGVDLLGSYVVRGVFTPNSADIYAVEMYHAVQKAENV